MRPRHAVWTRLREDWRIAVVENRLRTKDGSYRYCEWSATADLDIGGSTSSGRDVTERHEIDELLRESRGACGGDRGTGPVANDRIAIPGSMDLPPPSSASCNEWEKAGRRMDGGVPFDRTDSSTT